MLSAKGHGWSFFGGLFCSTRHCKAQAYVTVFSLGISRMSQQAKADATGGMNLCWWRHGGAGGAWNWASSGSSSCMCFGSLNEALTCRANFSMSSSKTVDSSAHQPGTSHLSAFHRTHVAGSDMGGSGDIPLFSSSVILDYPCKKEATSAWSCGGSPKSESLPFRPHSARRHIRVGGSASCRLATEAGLTLPFPAPVFRSKTIPSSPFRARMGFLPIQPFDLFFQSCRSQQGILMCITHSG